MCSQLWMVLGQSDFVATMEQIPPISSQQDPVLQF